MTATLDDTRDEWAERDAHMAVAIEGFSARTATILAAPDLPAPVVELATIVRDLLHLIQATLDDDYSEAHS